MKTGKRVVGRVRAPKRVSAYLHHVGAGGRKERLADRSTRPLYHLSEADTGGAQEVAGLAALSGGSDLSWSLPDGFLVTYVVPNFAALYNSMEAKLPLAHAILIAVGTTARSYVLLGVSAHGCRRLRRLFLVAAGVFPGNDRPLEDADAAARRNLD